MARNGGGFLRRQRVSLPLLRPPACPQASRLSRTAEEEDEATCRGWRRLSRRLETSAPPCSLLHGAPASSHRQRPFGVSTSAHSCHGMAESSTTTEHGGGGQVQHGLWETGPDVSPRPHMSGAPRGWRVWGFRFLAFSDVGLPWVCMLCYSRSWQFTGAAQGRPHVEMIVPLRVPCHGASAMCWPRDPQKSLEECFIWCETCQKGCRRRPANASDRGTVPPRAWGGSLRPPPSFYLHTGARGTNMA